MSDLEVIWDERKELACIVDVDNRVGWGPAMIGPNAGEILQAWLDSTPFDMSDTDSYTARRFFDSFLSNMSNMADTATTTPADVEASANGNPDVVATDVATAAEGAPTDEPPAAAPADTDMEAHQGTQNQVIDCYNCNGTGMVQFGGEEADQRCNMCHGTGKLSVAAAAG